MHYTTKAIILKKVAYGEADLIVTFFGREEGRLSGIAKHARASQRRFGGALEFGSIVDLRYVSRGASDMVRIEDAHVAYPTVGVMQSLDRIGAMSRALELALAFIPERQAAPEKFDLLAGYIASLSTKEPTPSSQIAFELRWLSLVGYQPALARCMRCGGEAVGGGVWSFSMDHGGVFCKRCSGFPSPLRGEACPELAPSFVEGRSRRGGGEGRIYIKDQTLQSMRLLSNGGEVTLNESDSRVIRGLLASYVQHLLGKPLPGRSAFEKW